MARKLEQEGGLFWLPSLLLHSHLGVRREAGRVVMSLCRLRWMRCALLLHDLHGAVSGLLDARGATAEEAREQALADLAVEIGQDDEQEEGDDNRSPTQGRNGSEDGDANGETAGKGAAGEVLAANAPAPVLSSSPVDVHALHGITHTVDSPGGEGSDPHMVSMPTMHSRPDSKESESGVHPISAEGINSSLPIAI